MQRVRAEQRGLDLIIHLDRPLNQDHLETVAGSSDQFFVDFEVADPRKARAQQRSLFFALMGDIEAWSFTPKDYLKEMFYTWYAVEYDGREISLADDTKSSVTDANNLLDIVIDFMFEWHVPFKKGYEKLQKDEQFFLYQCCRHRVCTICYKHADIHHIDVVGRVDRTKIDHTKRHVMALCREHHSEIESIGAVKFSAKYHVPVNGVLLKLEDLKKLGIKGNYIDEKDTKHDRR